jgi:predicted O-linked N-acetylglucosamine transferase (SPINDLY family)/glycosyltransferase involved in cell wall biosynthesis
MPLFPQPKRPVKPVGAHAKKALAKKKSATKIKLTGDPAADRQLLEEALKSRPPNFAGWMGLAQMAYSSGDVKQSTRAALVALEHAKKPDQMLAVASLLSRLGEIRKALVATKAGYEQLGRPLEHAAVALYTALAAADWPLVDSLLADIRQAHAAGDIARLAEGPRTHLLWCADEAINVAAISGYMLRRYPDVETPPPFALAPLKGRRMRIGYLSSDYRDHATSWLINGLFRHHDLTRVELFAYCCGWDDGSEMRKQVLSRFEHVYSVSAISDTAAAQKIRADQIDVLVDLNGPTRGNRLGILAQRVAPVQISYLGFPGTCGGRFVDYIVADEYVLPVSVENLYPEKIIRLSKTYQINDYAARERPPVTPRHKVGLPERALVLGVFNAVNKIRADVWSVWMEILKAVPQSVLWLLDPGDIGRENIARFTAAAGVDPKRVIAAKRMPQVLHTARLGCCDLMLDTWPYGGHTTTADAIFAGVPVVTLVGTNFASRVSGGLLRAAGLEVLVQPNIQAYVQFAVKLLQNPAEIRKMKEFINSLVLQNDVFNARSKARQLEDAYAVVAERAALQLAPIHVGFTKPSKAKSQEALTAPTEQKVRAPKARAVATAAPPAPASSAASVEVVTHRMSAPAQTLGSVTAPVWVIDPSLSSGPSHHRPLNQALAGIAQKRNEAWLFFGHQSAAMDFPIVSCFRNGVYINALDWLDWLKQGSRCAAMFAEDMQISVSSRFGNAHPHCVFHSMTPVLLIGLARWLQKLPRESFPSAISLHFMVAPDFGAHAYGPAKGMVQDAVAVILAMTQQAAIPLRATVHHPALLPTWRAMGVPGLQVAPVPLSCPGATRTRAFNQRTRLLFIGPPLQRKGFDLLISALPQLLKQMPELDVRLVCALSDSNLEAKLLSLQNPRISVRVDSFIPQDVYEAELADADLVYCAYLPDAYAQMASNIFWESQALGVPALVMAGTAAEMDASAVDGRGMLLVKEPKPSEVVAACEKFHAERALYREQAESVKDVYRALLAGESWVTHHLAPATLTHTATADEKVDQ